MALKGGVALIVVIVKNHLEVESNSRAELANFWQVKV